MNDHLTSRELSELVSGLVNPANERHVRDCLVCRAEAENLSGALAVFRQSVRDWSMEQEPPHAPDPRWKALPRRVSLQRLGLAATLTACLIAGVSIHREKSAKPASARQTISDTELLVQINAQLSEAVPAPLEPLSPRMQ